MDAFGISIDQASADLNRYLGMAPENMVYVRRRLLQGLLARAHPRHPRHRPSEVDAGQDADWHTHVILEIGPHPGLSDAQKKVTALDNGMRHGKARITVCEALLHYALRRLGLDIGPAARNPSDGQIALLNREVVGKTGQAIPPPS